MILVWCILCMCGLNTAGKKSKSIYTFGIGENEYCIVKVEKEGGKAEAPVSDNKSAGNSASNSSGKETVSSTDGRSKCYEDISVETVDVTLRKLRNYPTLEVLKKANFSEDEDMNWHANIISINKSFAKIYNSLKASVCKGKVVCKDATTFRNELQKILVCSNEKLYVCLFVVKEGPIYMKKFIEMANEMRNGLLFLEKMVIDVEGGEPSMQMAYEKKEKMSEMSCLEVRTTLELFVDNMMFAKRFIESNREEVKEVVGDKTFDIYEMDMRVQFVDGGNVAQKEESKTEESTAKTADGKKKEEKKIPGWIWLLVAIAVCIVICCCLIAYYYTKK